MSVYLCNAFSIKMVRKILPVNISMEKIPRPSHEELMAMRSAIGHADTAVVLGVPCNRCNVSLERGDSVIVAQLTSGRLPEGTTTLPKGFDFEFIRVTVM